MRSPAGFAVGLVCTVCDHEYQLEPGRYVCDECGDVGTLDVRYDIDLVAGVLSPDRLAGDPDRTMFRYRPLLPIEPDAATPLVAVGGTPLVPAPRLAERYGLAAVHVKDEGRQPTASLKDRASAIAVMKAIAEGAEIITTASTGNAAAALAGMAASMDQRSVIFVPAAAPQAKIAQLLAYGATVVLVEGSYDQAFDLSMEAAAKYGWYQRNTGYNPYVAEGKKTAMLEVLEQLTWQAPDVVFVGVGDGSIIGGLHKGIKDALALGWIDRIPRLIGVQAAGSSYLADAFEFDEDVTVKGPAPADTIADSISAALPRDRVKALAAVRETGGVFLRVADPDILAAIAELAAATGVFAEPAAAAAFAGMKQAVESGLIGGSDRVVVMSTGSGLKDVQAAMDAVADVGREPIRVAPNLAALELALTEKTT